MASQQTLVLYPAVDVHDLGTQRVDIHLFPAINGGIAHSKRATLPIATTEGIEYLQLTHPVHLTRPGCLAPGTLEVESLQRSTISLLCLGGTVSYEVEPEISTCHLMSPAPIVLMGKTFFDNDLNPIDLYSSELGAWLSIMRARARGDTTGFDRLLIDVPPFTLYAQGLLLAARRLGEVPVEERSERYWRAHNVISDALAAAKRRTDWPDPLPNLEALLAVSARN